MLPILNLCIVQSTKGTQCNSHCLQWEQQNTKMTLWSYNKQHLFKETHSHIHRRALSKLTSLLDLLAASLPSRCPLPLYTWWRISPPLKCLSLPADTQGHLPGFKQHLNATSTQSTSSNCIQIGSHLPFLVLIRKM